MRVFVSSVMRGFESERKAAQSAVESLGHEAIMAERLPSQDRSSQAACLAGVNGSDCYLGILGERYGFVTAAQVSVTEEEFEAAKRKGVPILIFVKAGDREAAQEQFIARLGGYESGYFYGQFSTDAELVAAVTKALTRLERDRSSHKQGQASSRLTEILSDKPQSSDGPCIRVAMVPVESREYIDPVRLGKKALRDALLRLALFESGVFSTELGNRCSDAREHVRLSQTDRREVDVHTIDVHTDGAILVTSSNQPRPRRSPVDDWYADGLVDQDHVARQIQGALRFGGSVYQAIVGAPRPSRALVHVSLVNVQGKKFGRRPSRPVTSWSYGFQGLPEDILVPRQAHVATVTEMIAPDALVVRFVTLIERVFRESGSYFEQSQTRR